MITNQFEESQSEDSQLKGLTSAQQVDQILAAITPNLKRPESLNDAKAEVEHIVADPNTFRFGADQRIIEVSSGLESIRHGIQLHDKQLNRIQNRLSTHHNNFTDNSRKLNQWNTEIDTVADRIAQIDEDIELIEVYEGMAPLDPVDGDSTSEADFTQMSDMIAERVFGRNDEEDADQSGNAEDYFQGMI
jgi:uncharacterized coiled-coil DUF342 family protein